MLNSRNHLMENQVKLMFGVTHDQLSLNEFSYLSQVSQAEAMKFFLECSRSLKWQRSGIIWWNLLDGWPQISDAVVDYYFVKKRTFRYLQRSQQPVLLFFDELSGWAHKIMATNDTLKAAQIRYTIKQADSGQVVLAGEALIPPGTKWSLARCKTLTAASSYT